MGGAHRTRGFVPSEPGAGFSGPGMFPRRIKALWKEKTTWSWRALPQFLGNKAEAKTPQEPNPIAFLSGIRHAPQHSQPQLFYQNGANPKFQHVFQSTPQTNHGCCDLGLSQAGGEPGVPCSQTHSNDSLGPHK